jgi:hypothetical protein
MRKGIKKRISLAALAGCIAVGALAVAGCGGGSSSTTGASGASGASGAALSKDEFVSQAEAICKEANDKIAAQKPPASNQLSDVQATIQEELPVNQNAYNKFSALSPPSDLQAQFNQLVATGKAQIALAQQLLKTNDVNTANSIIAKAKGLGDRFDSIARSMGLPECAKDVQPQG